MPSHLVCRPEQDASVAVLRISGTLDPVTGDALQHAVRHSLAAQPTRLLLDVAALRVGDPVGLAALSAVTGQAAEWPNVPIVLCGASPEARGIIGEAPGCADLMHASGIEEAMAEAAADPEPKRIRVRLRPVPDACRQVRTLVTQTCQAWQLPALTGTAGLIATELMANVVRHARTTALFTVGLRGDRFSLTVRDGSRRMPKPGDPGPGDTGGRGLRLVRDLTDAWGVLPIHDGKVVWTLMAAS